MILGLGTDLVDARRIETLLNKHEQRFLDKYFTAQEIETYKSRQESGSHILYLAKRFAAKEAFAKAMGTGIQEGLFMKEIEIINDKKGRPFIQCHGRAFAALENFSHGCKACKIHLSLTDEPPYAQATVIIEAI